MPVVCLSQCLLSTHLFRVSLSVVDLRLHTYPGCICQAAEDIRIFCPFRLRQLVILTCQKAKKAFLLETNDTDSKCYTASNIAVFPPEATSSLSDTYLIFYCTLNQAKKKGNKENSMF